MSASHEYKSFFYDLPVLKDAHLAIKDFLQNNHGLELFEKIGFSITTNDLGVPVEKAFHQAADTVLGSWLVCIVLVLVALMARMKLKSVYSRKGLEKYHADSGVSFRNVFELYTLFIYNTLTNNLSRKDAQAYFWFFGGVFIYIFGSNIIGVLPGGAPPTQNFSNNLIISVVVLVMFVAIGLARQGMGFFKHMAGPVLLLAPLMFAIELFSTIIVRPASLTIRLTGNMNGDHEVLGVAYSLSEAVGGIGLPVAALCLGAFVAFLQAFVFTLLSVVYVVLSIGHGDEHH